MAMTPEITTEAQGLSETYRAIIEKTAYCIDHDLLPKCELPYDEAFWKCFQEPFYTPAIAHLGDMRKLPLEVLHSIFREMTVETCINFRKVNRRARQAVTNSLEYRELATNTLVFLSKLVKPDIAKHFTMIDVHNVLHQPKCEWCGKLGQNIFLLQMTRYCTTCVPHERYDFSHIYGGPDRCSVVAISTLSKRIRMTPKRICSMVPSIPSRYGHLRVLSLDEVIVRLEKYLRGYDKQQLKNSLPRRFSGEAMVKAPYVEPTGHRQFGYGCKGCTVPRPSPTIYTTEGFMKHFKSCRRAKFLWEKKDTIEGEIEARVTERLMEILYTRFPGPPYWS